MKAYSQDLRDRVISRYKTGKYTIRELSECYSISRQTISIWIGRYKENGDYSSKQHIQTGRQAKFTDKDKVLEFLTNNPDSNAIDIRNKLAPGLPMSTMYDTLHRMNITYKKKSLNIKIGMKNQERNL